MSPRGPTGEQPRRRRFFFALWPEPSVRQALVRATRSAVRRCGGRPTSAENLHLTVAFLGAITNGELAEARRVPPIPTPPFSLRLDTLGFWNRSRILWLGASGAPAELMALERMLWSGLGEAGFEREPRAFLPHLTLARQGRPVTASIKAVEWPVTDLALVESVPGRGSSTYHRREQWRLNG